MRNKLYLTFTLSSPFCSHSPIHTLSSLLILLGSLSLAMLSLTLKFSLAQLACKPSSRPNVSYLHDSLQSFSVIKRRPLEPPSFALCHFSCQSLSLLKKKSILLGNTRDLKALCSRIPFCLLFILVKGQISSSNL